MPRHAAGDSRAMTGFAATLVAGWERRRKQHGHSCPRLTDQRHGHSRRRPCIRAGEAFYSGTQNI
jgi:hypothetical protein